MNSYHKVRLLTSSFTLKCSSDCVMLYEENALNCGGQASCFCIRQCSRPHSIQCASVSHEKRDDNGSALPYSPDLAACDFFLFPRMKRDLKGKLFQNVEEVREKDDGGTEDYHFARVPELF